MVAAVGIFFIVLVVLLIAAAAGWVTFTQLRARRLGLPAPTFSSYNPFARSEPSRYGPPQPAPGGVRGWLNDKFRSFQNSRNRSAAGAYEQPLRGGARGFGPLDPDEAWDSRVGHEADNYGPGGYYEEQELGLHHGGRGADTSYGGAYDANLAPTPGAASFTDEEDRGRTKSRGGSHLSAPGHSGQNPFDDDVEPSNMSLRGVSPRPIDTSSASKAGGGGGAPESPTERRSVFREEV